MSLTGAAEALAAFAERFIAEDRPTQAVAAIALAFLPEEDAAGRAAAHRARAEARRLLGRPLRAAAHPPAPG